MTVRETARAMVKPSWKKFSILEISNIGIFLYLYNSKGTRGKYEPGTAVAWLKFLSGFLSIVLAVVAVVSYLWVRSERSLKFDEQRRARQADEEQRYAAWYNSLTFEQQMQVRIERNTSILAEDVIDRRNAPFNDIRLRE